MADEVVVVASLPVQEGKLDEAITALSAAAEAVHREESGVKKYALHTDPKDPNRLVMIEVYASQADLDAHGQTPHMAELMGALGGVLGGRPELTILTPVTAGDPAKGLLGG